VHLFHLFCGVRIVFHDMLCHSLDHFIPGCCGQRSKEILFRRISLAKSA
jgi:hypothetical protein